MGIFNALKSQLIDIIEWRDDTPDTMVWRFQRPDDEIMNGAKLVVREGQAAALVSQGQLADVFLPGTHVLATENVPVLSKLMGWKYGFHSPFKAEVYFVSTRVFTDRKWGTKNPIMMRDADFGVVRLRAFGTYAVRAKYPPVLLRNLVGTASRFSIDDINDQLRDLLTAKVSDALGNGHVAAIDLAGHYAEMATPICQAIDPDFAALGLELVKFVIENVSLPPEVEAAMDKRTSMGVIGDMGKFSQFSAANAIGDAARNPSGLAGAGAALGVGMAMAGQFAPATAPQPPSTAAAAPPPLPSAASYFAAVAGKQAGPFDRDQLRSAIGGGQVTRQTLVWSAGMSAWTAAGQVAELSDLFASVPPPLPASS
jgi:membrane protease subunit (stomatin/prohibitin family)